MKESEKDLQDSINMQAGIPISQVGGDTKKWS